MLAVLYLIFNEGYSATAGDAPIRRELCDEAIRLALLAVLMPDEPEALGLLALLLLQDSRRDAWLGPDGDLVLLEDQDRSRWNMARIDEGLRVSSALTGCGGRASTRSRRRSRPAMRRAPTGRPSPRCTTVWSSSSPRRSPS